MVLLNKTQIYGTRKNGDSKMLMNIQAGITDPKNGYKTWAYPTDRRRGSESTTGQNTWPEIIEPCQEEMGLQCGDAEGCTLVVGVVGLTTNKFSSYRLKGFYGTNKLKLD